VHPQAAKAAEEASLALPGAVAGLGAEPNIKPSINSSQQHLPLACTTPSHLCAQRAPTGGKSRRGSEPGFARRSGGAWGRAPFK